MNDLYTVRIENKTLISKEQFLLLQSFIYENFHKISSNEKYSVSTVYFCKWSFGNQKGKIRLRIYNNKDYFIEEKKKINHKTYKKRYAINKKIYNEYIKINSLNELYILNQKYSFCFDDKYIKYGSFNKLKIVYDREVIQILYNKQPIRITYDLNLLIDNCDLPNFKTSNLIQDNLIIMEIKGNQLTDFIDKLNIEFGIELLHISKYNLARWY